MRVSYSITESENEPAETQQSRALSPAPALPGPVRAGAAASGHYPDGHSGRKTYRALDCSAATSPRKANKPSAPGMYLHQALAVLREIPRPLYLISAILVDIA
jgi:hypothetical protein